MFTFVINDKVVLLSCVLYEMTLRSSLDKIALAHLVLFIMLVKYFKS